MPQDITNRKDIEHLVEQFYQEAVSDAQIGHFFEGVIAKGLEKHLPTICDFWESVLLQQPVYKGNPMLKHIALDKEKPFSPAHFQRWIQLWEMTVDTLFQGPVAEEAKRRAQMMGQLMLYKIEQSRNPGFIQ